MIWCWRPLVGAAGSCFRTTEAIDFLGLGVVHAGNSWCLEPVDGVDAGYGVSKTLWLILQGLLFLLQCSCSCSCSWCCWSCFASSSRPTRFVTGRGGSCCCCCCLWRFVAPAISSRRLRIHSEGRRRTCTKKPNNNNS